MTIIQALVLLTVMFLTAVVVLRRLMARHVTTATAHLQALSQDYVRKQEEFKKRLEESERQYQEHVAQAKEEAQQLKTQMVTEAEQARERILEQARQDADRIVQQATQAREAMRQELEQSLENRAIEHGCALLHQALPVELRQAIHTQWMDELLKNGLLSTEQLTTSETVREARVVSAFALTPTQHQTLLARLQKAVGSDVTLQATVDDRLVAGLTITLGHVEMDGSLGSKLREAARDAHRRFQ